MHGGLFFLYLAAAMAQETRRPIVDPSQTVLEDILTTEPGETTPPMVLDPGFHSYLPSTPPTTFRSSFPNTTSVDNTPSAAKPLLLISALILGVLAYGIFCIPQPRHRTKMDDYNDDHVEEYPAFFVGLIDKP
jgi:hypothetical protein